MVELPVRSKPQSSVAMAIRLLRLLAVALPALSGISLPGHEHELVVCGLPGCDWSDHFVDVPWAQCYKHPNEDARYMEHGETKTLRCHGGNGTCLEQISYTFDHSVRSSCPLCSKHQGG